MFTVGNIITDKLSSTSQKYGISTEIVSEWEII